MIRNRRDLTPAEERLIGTFMGRLHNAPLGVHSGVPGADVLWLKAQLIRRWDAQRRVQEPIDLMEPFEIAAGVAAAVLLLFWSVPSAFEWLPRVF
jgi:hypothetical protein